MAWTVEGSAFTLELVVPANSTAAVSLPDGTETFQVGSGRHTFDREITVPAPVEMPQPFFGAE